MKTRRFGVQNDVGISVNIVHVSWTSTNQGSLQGFLTRFIWSGSYAVVRVVVTRMRFSCLSCIVEGLSDWTSGSGAEVSRERWRQAAQKKAIQELQGHGILGLQLCAIRIRY